ncbi:MAG: methyltransferase [candidate division Zixibacteria bacterium SM23_73_3]|nr:MAG: methyltransferase [candidate division Zixibacteria bacterium SM23_73_3]
MFHNIPKTIEERMHYLESLDNQDRLDEKPLLQRLRQIPPDTGKFIALLAATAPQGTYLEIGTSAGYSTLWLALACKELGRNLVTFEVLEEKAHLAKETFKVAGVEEVIELVTGDAREYLHNYRNVSFCFLDAEKEAYYDCYKKVVPNMVSGGLLVADNAMSHKNELKAMLERALSDQRMDALIVPIGRGELVCRRL